MTRPRLAAILSGIAASTVAFLVVHRWSLAGTLTGAAVVPIVYTLVSHWSNEGLDRLSRWARRHARPAAGQGLSEDDAIPQPTPGGYPLRRVYVTRGPAVAHRRPKRLQWVLAAVTVMAFAFSLYSFATAGTVERVVVQRQVVEKTVIVPASVADRADPGEQTGTPATTTAPPVDQEQDTTTTTTTTSSATSEPGPSQPEETSPSSP
jgi:hypothetical protein